MIVNSDYRKNLKKQNNNNKKKEQFLHRKKLIPQVLRDTYYL